MVARRPNEFEKAFQNLEKIVQRLESEELPLDESLQLFEEGIKLSRFCHQRLEEVEKKIELILADAKGQPATDEATVQFPPGTGLLRLTPVTVQFCW